MDNQNIKEILDNFKDYEKRYKKCNETQFIIFYRDIHLLLDYITNLQEEKDKYKDVIDRIKEYAKANKIIEIIALLEVEEVE